MDPERQPLLRNTINEDRYRRSRPLTYEEVQRTHHELVWCRTRFFLVLMFWAVMAMTLSMITWLLAKAPACRSHGDTVYLPSVPPVHMSFTPLVSRLNEQFYAL